VAEVKFAEWTRDGVMRQPVFLGMRDDLDPREVRREQPHDADREMAQANRTVKPSAKPATRATATRAAGSRVKRQQVARKTSTPVARPRVSAPSKATAADIPATPLSGRRPRSRKSWGLTFVAPPLAS